MKWCILKNEFDDNHKNWMIACEKYGQNYDVVDLTKSNWLEEISKFDYIGFLTCPSGRESLYKQLYDERIYVINKVMKKFCYPNYDEIVIHENKKFLYYWLKANKLPHPKTYVFYDKEEALSFANEVALPIVGKFNIGASGKGVKIFRDRKSLIKYIESAFIKGLRQDWGPNMRMGNWIFRLKKIFKNPSRIKNRIEVYKRVYNEIQKGFVILQKYIPHDFEWRVVCIGESYFGYKKKKIGDKCSGGKGYIYDVPTETLLNFVKDICTKYLFNTMAFDLFEDGNGVYLINEMQTIFGHVKDHICEKNGKPGRLVFASGKWKFEEGMFNSNLSYDLRMEDAIRLTKK
ncbi:hypothetical protein Calab_0558 [Caldithrix abyssi DSM 13497]|uniref:Glutathione synthase/RimK-type ligase, ATP-grasp superfamily n=1 Tax=Caldithrix abyssi DSM 13497 TaxID=880073 RepID=H1XRP8_CALAY|nr:hypothetical protein [Caldithrix abyssi]APF20140.1 Glutathione synthase/RimK-type ligase, ATP-grasp superfamily [Caldithrix abyssi DSM 13497]EHO40201.1 hypothetical protein Calab_0558 [Caldithrix abyssi DSM 13497]